MLRNLLSINKHCRDAVLFIVLSLLIVYGAIGIKDQKQDAPPCGQTNMANYQTDHDDIPAEVIKEADDCAYKEWKYVSSTFPERNYCEYKLESVSHVLTCQHVDDETFEVYGITCSYRSENYEKWETAENVANTFMVFRTATNNSMEWIGDFSSYYEPETKDFENDVHEVLMEADEQYIFKLLANDSLDQVLEEQ